jgi:hypothetical protein
MTSITYQPRILGQNTPRNRHTRLLPLAQPLHDLLVTDLHIYAVLLRINRDHIAVLHHRNRPTDCGLRTYVADDEAMGRARVAAVGDEGDVCELCAEDGGGGFELLGHAWTAFGTFVAHDDYDVGAAGNEAGVEGGVKLMFFVEDLEISVSLLRLMNVQEWRRCVYHGFTLEYQALFSGDLRDCTSGREIAAKDLDMTCCFDGIAKWTDENLVLR